MGIKSKAECADEIKELTLLYFLEAAEGRRDNLAEKKFTLAGGGTLTCPILTGGGHGADIYYQVQRC